jgi:cytochrome c556
MSRINVSWRLVVVAAAVAGVAVTCWAAAPPATKPAPPRLEAVAETRLLMEGLAQANFRGLEKMLKDKPADADAWAFTRGQALLIAETGNLLMLRPPRNQGQDTWMDRSTDLRNAAKSLAKASGNRDYEGSRAALGDVANACNRCHQTFRVSVRIVPFAEPAERPAAP